VLEADHSSTHKCAQYSSRSRVIGKDAKDVLKGKGLTLRITLQLLVQAEIYMLALDKD
jgi:hypothetical protein